MPSSNRTYRDPEETDVNYKEKVAAMEQASAAEDVIRTYVNKDMDRETKLAAMRARMAVASAAKISDERLLNLKVKDYGLFVRAQQASRLAKRAEDSLKKLEAEESVLHLQMKVEAALSESAAETVDLKSPAAQKALERLSVQFPSVREEAEKKDFMKSALPVPIEPEKADPNNMSGELRSVYELYKQYDLSPTQLKIMNLLANPNICIDRYGDISKTAQAQMLGLSESEVALAYDKRLMATLHNESLLALRMSKILVDGALIASAANPDSRHNADRALYYRLIGALQDKSDKSIVDRIPREKKLEVISKTIAKLTRDKNEAETLKERLLRGKND